MQLLSDTWIYITHNMSIITVKRI